MYFVEINGKVEKISDLIMSFFLHKPLIKISILNHCILVDKLKSFFFSINCIIIKFL